MSSGDNLWVNLEATGHGLLRAPVGAGLGKPRKEGLEMP